jgi:hypothetical protein
MLSRSEASLSPIQTPRLCHAEHSEASVQANKANNARSLSKEKEHRPISTLSFRSSFTLLANGNTLPPIQFITDGAFANSWGNRRCRFIVHIADLSAWFSSTNFPNASQISYSVKAPMKVAHQLT